MILCKLTASLSHAKLCKLIQTINIGTRNDNMCIRKLHFSFVPDKKKYAAGKKTIKLNKCLVDE